MNCEKDFFEGRNIMDKCYAWIYFKGLGNTTKRKLKQYSRVTVQNRM
jgi:hypothetical protein